ncbi:UNKNOWN [Stylonychia lemnae]|uniref:Uncharacterized protein n=1 Tax=Stylonychia lemnae TaxID=5949 RepID=A0A078B190_STYLE|nr:UNKNOWN [Stylonychia lemnae]|eukprot:CDW88096.1 UNKNOWN [Stylonychia lemnae]
MYSFGSQDRFQKTKEPYCQRSAYDVPSRKQKRAAGFGYGKKHATMISEKTIEQQPAPGTYEIPSDFNLHRKSVPNLFGSSARDKLFEQVKVHGKMPGPGQYDHMKTRNDAPSYTFRQRTSFHDFLNLQAKIKVPGPGEYTPRVELSDPASFINSKFKHEGSTIFPTINSGSSSQRFPYVSKEKLPSPQEYNIMTQSMSGEGKYMISKFKNSRAPKISPGKIRGDKDLVLNNNPGPGSYQPFSEFGKGKISSMNRYGLPKSMLKTVD